MQKTKAQPKKQIIQVAVEKDGKIVEPDLVVPATLDEDAVEDDGAREDEEANFVEMDSFDDEE